jgi:hypothetical protein
MSISVETTASPATSPAQERMALLKSPPMGMTNLYPPFDRFMAEAPEDVFTTPSMMSTNERLFLYNIANRYYYGAGRIVDAGIFLGGSTRAFAAGIRQNKHLTKILDRWPRPILSLERGVVSPTMPAFFQRNYIGAHYQPGDSFADLLAEFVAPCADLVELRVGDIVEHGRTKDRIEILFLDVLKNPKIAAFAVAEYFPRLIPGRSIVVQQDYFFESLPFIKTYQEFFQEQFDYVGEIGSSAIFRCRAKIEKDAIEEVVRGLPAKRQIHLASVALQRSKDPLRRLMMAMSKTLLIHQLNGAAAARTYLGFVEDEFAGEIRHMPASRLAQPLRALRTLCEVGPG